MQLREASRFAAESAVPCTHKRWGIACLGLVLKRTHGLRQVAVTSTARAVRPGRMGGVQTSHSVEAP
jgi:hypothetical protein